MTIVTSTVKGQIVIPTDIRRKYGIEKGTRFKVYEQKNKIIVEPLKRDPDNFWALNNFHLLAFHPF